jgi:8-oxo-dGTP pyrophosphatase MutT (NUDIX family)
MYYKIYIRESCVVLTNEAASVLNLAQEPEFVAPFPRKKKFILNYVDALEKSAEARTFVFIADDIEKAWQAFKECFEWIEAAGGLVFNEKKEILAIFRKGYWDLPKGKIDPGEDAETAATREVGEETGAVDLRLGPKIGATWHVYRMGKAVRVLKQTHWFAFETHSQLLVPQADEDIEQACWMDFEAFVRVEPTYASIREISQQYLSV